MAMIRCSVGRWAPLWLTASLVALAVPATALGQGQPLGPEPSLEFEGRMGYSATADTLLDCGAAACAGGLGIDVGGLNCAGRDASTVQLDDIPVTPELRIVHARLNWAASTPVDALSDLQVTLTPPGGEPIEVLADNELSERFNDGAPAQDCQVVELLCGISPACDLGFYSNFADVTAQLNAHYEAGGISTASGASATSRSPAPTIRIPRR